MAGQSNNFLVAASNLGTVERDLGKRSKATIRCTVRFCSIDCFWGKRLIIDLVCQSSPHPHFGRFLGVFDAHPSAPAPLGR